MSELTAMEWLIKELDLRRLEALEINNGDFFLTETLEAALVHEAEQRKADYQRGLQDCTEGESEENTSTTDDLPFN